MSSPVTARQCAEKWGVSEAQARRILSPVDPVGRQKPSGAFLYPPADAEQARVDMPGRGYRTDLVGKPLVHGLSGYRRRCPCSVCRGASAAAEAARRRSKRYGPQGPVNAKVRQQVLRLVRKGLTVIEAAPLAGITHQAAYGAARALPRFRQQLEKATQRD